MALTLTRSGLEQDAQRALRRVALGLALSLAAHVLLLSAWRNPPAATPAFAARPLAVRLQPPAPRVEPPAPPEPAPRASELAAKRPARRAASPRPRSVIALPREQAPPEPDAFVVEQPPEAPRFDPDAARRMARALANMRDPAKEGTAIGQFPEKPLETESRAARAIGAAKRRDCKDGIPGGLLAPLILLADKKDSGCKW